MLYFKELRDWRLRIGLIFSACLIYFSCLAPEEFTSQSVFVVKSISGENSVPSGIELFGAGVSSNTTTPVIQAYLKSAAIGETLNNELGFFDHIVEGAGVFALSGLHHSVDTLLNKSIKSIELSLGASDDVLILNTTAYSAVMAQDMNKVIKVGVEGLIDRINKAKSDAKIDNAEHMLFSAKSELDLVRKELDVLRVESNSISPSIDSKVQRSNIANLEMELMQAKVELSEKMTYLSPNSSVVKQLESKVMNLAGNINNESSINVDMTNSFDFEQLQFDVELLQKAYQYAQLNVEQVRQEAIAGTIALIDISPATKPTSRVKPRVLYDSLNYTIIFSVILALVSMVRDLFIDKKGNTNAKS